MTVPSAIGIISSYFVGPDRTRALSIYGASGAVGFCSGLIFGGFLSSSLGWKYIFRPSGDNRVACASQGSVGGPGSREAGLCWRSHVDGGLDLAVVCAFQWGCVWLGQALYYRLVGCLVRAAGHLYLA